MIKRVGTALLAVAVWLAVWEIVYLLVNVDLLVPSPRQILLTLIDMVPRLSFWFTIGSTVLRVVIGFVAGFLLGALFALAAFRFSVVARLLSPVIYAVKSTPVASFIILALFWLTTETVPSFICLLMVLPVVYGNVTQGLRSVDRDLLEMGKVYRFSFFKRMRRIYLPSVIPYFLAASDIGLGLSWKAGIAAEVICRCRSSIGNEIYQSKFNLEIREMFAWTAIVILLSVVFDQLLKVVSKRLKQKKYSEEEAEA